MKEVEQDSNKNGNFLYRRNMKTLKFTGHVINGIGKHSELGVPGKLDLDCSPADWPEALYPGSLNIDISSDGYPSEFKELNPKMAVTKLDSKFFPALFTIPQNHMQNNKLISRGDESERGVGQVWRAMVINETSGQSLSAWVLRRIGSGLGHQLEIVSNVHLRDTLALDNRTTVTVIMESGDDKG